MKKKKRLTLCEVEDAINLNQPRLRVEKNVQSFLVRGTFLVFEAEAVCNPAGPLTRFEIEIIIPDRFPHFEPRLFEIGGRIPRKLCRHINGSGSCCVAVWEHWLIEADDISIAGYLNGPVNEFFLGQYYYENKGEWPFGEHSHGREGLIEAYSGLLRVPPREQNIVNYLRTLAQEGPRGHRLCPCGSGEKLRDCHYKLMIKLHKSIPPPMANRMLKRLNSKN